MSLLNRAFDASSSVFLVMSAVVSDLHVELATVSLGFLVFPVSLLLVVSCFLWRDEPFLPPDPPNGDVYIALTELPRLTQLDEESCPDELSPEHRALSKYTELSTRTSASRSRSTASLESSASQTPGAGENLELQVLPFRRQACTPEFFGYTAFHAVAILHLYFFLGTERCV